MTAPVPLKIAINELGFDFDGVIADTAEAFIRLACHQHSYCSFTHQDITDFEVENCLDMPKSLVDRIFTDILNDSLGAGLQPMPGAVEHLERFAGIGPVTIITARPITQPVFDWLEVHFSETARQQFRVIGTGDHNDKVRHIHDCGLRYFIDDRAETCRQLAQEEITPLVFCQPWNNTGHGLPTIASWQEIAALIDTSKKEEL